MTPIPWPLLEADRLKEADLDAMETLNRSGDTLTKADERERWMLRMLPRLLQVTRSLRVPHDCEFRVATRLDKALGCAGFRDAPKSFGQPFILVDQKGFDLCHTGHLFAFYRGLVVHESGHILFTRDGYARKKKLTSAFARVIHNYLEDVRIESLLRHTAPGFAESLHLLRCITDYPVTVLYRDRFHVLPDIDRIHFLMYSMLICPHLMTAEMQQWQTLDGRVPFEDLLIILCHEPRTESEVADLTINLENYITERRKAFPTLAQFALTEESERNIHSRILRQLEADREDKAIASRETADMVASLVDSAEQLARIPRADLRAAADRLLEIGIQLEACDEISDVQRGRRFSLDSLSRGQNQKTQVTHPFSREAAERLADPSADDLREIRDFNRDQPLRTMAAAWTWGKERRTEIENAPVTAESSRIYAERRETVLNQICVLRSVFRLRFQQSTEYIKIREQVSGRIDARRLAIAAHSDRVFLQEQESTAPTTLVIGLLLDESGSMLRSDRAVHAANAAVMIVEAARNLPNTMVEVFSHTSSGRRNEHCLVRRLYGRTQKRAEAIGTYPANASENYDHQAILTTAELLGQTGPTRAIRILIVLSDGLPSGFEYSGEKAIDATRDVVINLRRRGMKVLNVAIADYCAEQIFGAENTLKLTTLPELVNQFRRVLTRLLRTVPR
ncbi:MAG: hypothetical protein ACK58L_04240 [Planctomycetota bacterium]